ncbi:MAG: hypothetical protein ACXU89_22135, partial [Xanthobacteraceae bacterium]
MLQCTSLEFGTKLTRLIVYRKLFRLTLIVLDRLSVWESDTPLVEHTKFQRLRLRLWLDDVQEGQMGEAQGIMGHPGVGLFSMLIIGGLAGWIA